MTLKDLISESSGLADFVRRRFPYAEKPMLVLLLLIVLINIFICIKNIYIIFKL